MGLRAHTLIGIIVAMAALPATSPRAATPSGLPHIAPVHFPAYGDYPDIKLYAPTRKAYRQAVDDRRFVMQRMTYLSDGLRVYAYVYRPRQVATGKRLPVVVFIRGSYVRRDFSPEVLMPAHRLAQHGYLVVAPMLRGSGGAKGHDEMGGADVHDIFNLLPALRRLSYADADRLFLYGESRGAIMSMIALRQSFPARAAAVYGLTADFSRLIGKGSPGRALATKIWPHFEKDEARITRTRSPIRWAERIEVPVLLMHGGNDRTVSPINALEMASAFQHLGKRYALRIFYGGNHVLTHRAAQRDRAAAAWFSRFDQ
ncbi:MAG: prolyl oligopeptidase family serine peptidase [Rhodanobacteraceae bacterium]